MHETLAFGSLIVSAFVGEQLAELPAVVAAVGNNRQPYSMVIDPPDAPVCLFHKVTTRYAPGPVGSLPPEQEDVAFAVRFIAPASRRDAIYPAAIEAFSRFAVLRERNFHGWTLGFLVESEWGQQDLAIGTVMHQCLGHIYTVTITGSGG